MPALTQSLPKYRKHRASGQAVVRIHGKDHYLGPHGTKASKELYDRLVAEYLSRGRDSYPGAHDCCSVAEVFLAYWKFAQGYYVKNGKKTNELDGLRLVIRDARKLYGTASATEFGPRALKTVREIWIERGQARPTINKNQRRLTRIFRWAVAEEMIPPTVLQALAAVPGLKKGRCDAPESSPVAPVDVHVVEQTIPLMLPVTADMVRFQLLTGARPGEVCSLRPCDIDRSKDVWEYSVDGHKTEHHGRSRTVYLGPAAQALLCPYLLRDELSDCFSPREAMDQYRAQRRERRTTPSSCGNGPGTNRKRQPRKKAGDRYDTNSYRHAIHYACDRAFPPPGELAKREGETAKKHIARLTEHEKAALDAWQKEHRWSPNQLRHTKATEIRRRFGLEAAQVILGHAAADVTQIYAERDAEKAREVARKIG